MERDREGSRDGLSILVTMRYHNLLNVSGFETRAQFLVVFKLSYLTNQWSERNDSFNSTSTNLQLITSHARSLQLFL